ncbi:MAG: hypothetical protein IJI59_15165 [Clostridia bacterium]|nr:hypothetical protein [Clostridia bacterium]
MERNSMIMDWNDTIQNDGKEFVTLPEGDYTFTVTNFERAHFPGSAKLPPCNKASLTLTIDNDLGIATARIDLILARSLEWKISSFFSSIGQKKQGETLKMDWDRVVGARGKAHFKPRKYTDRYGNEREANDVERFIPCDDPGGLVEAAADDDLPWEKSSF